MKSTLITVDVLFVYITIHAQQRTMWDKWAWLVGEWKGEGNGEPGQGSGTFSFQADLNEKVLISQKSF